MATETQFFNLCVTFILAVSLLGLVIMTLLVQDWLQNEAFMVGRISRTDRLIVIFMWSLVGVMVLMSIGALWIMYT